MKHTLLILAIMIFCVLYFTSCKDDTANSVVIYGEDNRVDLYDSDSSRQCLANSTLGLFDQSILIHHSGKYIISSTPYPISEPLCPQERFYSQETAPFCTAFLVKSDIVLTAGHCITRFTCHRTFFVFGFAVNPKGETPSKVPASDVYKCKTVVQSLATVDGSDFAVIELDREVVNRKPLKIRKAGTIDSDANLFVIGHPSGLPTKVADQAQVRDNSEKHFFTANLDTYAGNSGSPVFNEKTLEVEGILVNGEEDFEMRGPCMLSKRCPNDGCRGEGVTRISEVWEYL